MASRCERNGQIEFDIIEHKGQEFVALGATVIGRAITGYTRRTPAGITLATWCGQTMLGCRCEIVEHYWTDAMALVFRLTQGRFIVGYALADNGMLFRGELVTDGTSDDARRHAVQLAEQFAELDAEDEANFVADPW